MRFRFRTVLGLMGLLGCAAESLAGPFDLPGLKSASNAASAQNSFPYLSQDSPARELALETTADGPALDAGVSISRPELTGNPRDFSSLTPQLTAALNWSIRSRVAPLSKEYSDKPKHKKTPKDKCKGGPCPTTVPEPATAMLLVIGLGLAGVASHGRLRL